MSEVISCDLDFHGCKRGTVMLHCLSLCVIPGARETGVWMFMHSRARVHISDWRLSLLP